MEILNFDKLYKQYYNEVRARIDFKLSTIPTMRDQECTGDILSDSFYKLYKNLNNFDPEIAQFNTWFYTIVDNTIIDYIRRFSKQQNNVVRINCINSDNKVYEIPNHDNIGMENGIDEIKIKAEVVKAINKIKNAGHRNIAKLFFIDELTYGEISQTLSLPLGTVKPSVMRIKEFLQAELANMKANIYA